MTQSASNLVLTGSSGVGKSTLLKKVGQTLVPEIRIRGFFSDVIYSNGERVGWNLETFDGDGGLLIHLGIESTHRMGRYGVDMGLFERLVESQMPLCDDVDLYLIDEIGIVASWSPRFIALMSALLDSEKKVIAIIRAKGQGCAAEVKQRSDVELWEVTQENRESLFNDILRRLKQRKSE